MQTSDAARVLPQRESCIQHSKQRVDTHYRGGVSGGHYPLQGTCAHILAK